MNRRELIEAARRLGFRVEPTRGGHLAFRHPNGAVVTAASTPGDRRSWINAIATMRRSLRTLGVPPERPGHSGASAKAGPDRGTAVARKRRAPARPAARPEPPDGPTRLVERIGPDGRRVLTGTVHGLPTTLVATYEAGAWTWRRQRVEVR